LSATLEAEQADRIKQQSNINDGMTAAAVEARTSD
jgi:hypothetical protein